jgi:hypothetical protein
MIGTEREMEMCPCETCGQPTPMLGTKRCNGCWEVEHRLRYYLLDGKAKAAANLRRALEEAGL